MSDPAPRYPKRGNFFALKFGRLTAKICLANEIGAEAVLLLVNIALVEDAKSYRSAVTFFNEQLMPLVGLRSQESLVRARNKAVAAGWLHYERGWKGVAGKYWVLIPPDYDRMDDTPVDENPKDYSQLVSAKTEGEAKEKPRATAVRSQGEAKGNSGKKPSATADHSSLSLPVPVPREESVPSELTPVPGADDEEEPTGPSESGSKTVNKPPRAEATGPHADARRDFCARWKAKYRSETEYDWKFAKYGPHLKALLKIVGDDATKLAPMFARFFGDDDGFHAAESRHSFEKFRQHFGRWQIATPPSRAGPLGKAQDRDAYAANLGRRMLDEQQRLGLLDPPPDNPELAGGSP